MDILEKVRALEEKALEKKKPKSKTIKPTAEIIELPIWPEAIRGFPNVIARSALFNARRQNTPRDFVDKMPVSSIAGVDINYTGRELRQDDQTVLMQLIHLTQHQPFIESVQFTPYSFLKSIGWSTSGQQRYDKLFTIIDRMSVTGIHIESKGMFYVGSLIRKIGCIDKETGERLRIWTVWLEPEIIALFKSDGYCHIAWDQRIALKKPLAQWLQAYYATHKDPYPIKIETIRDLSGSKAVLLKKFKQTLKSALDELVTVGFLKSYTITKTGLVHVKRKGKSDKQATTDFLGTDY